MLFAFRSFGGGNIHETVAAIQKSDQGVWSYFFWRGKKGGGRARRKTNRLQISRRARLKRVRK